MVIYKNCTEMHGQRYIKHWTHCEPSFTFVLCGIYLVEDLPPPPTPHQKGGGLKFWCENNEICTAHGSFFNKKWCEQTTPPRNVCGHHSVLPTDHLACFVNFTTFTQLSIKNFPHICRAVSSGFGPQLQKINSFRGSSSARADCLEIFMLRFCWCEKHEKKCALLWLSDAEWFGIGLDRWNFAIDRFLIPQRKTKTY